MKLKDMVVYQDEFRDFKQGRAKMKGCDKIFNKYDNNKIGQNKFICGTHYGYTIYCDKCNQYVELNKDVQK